MEHPFNLIGTMGIEKRGKLFLDERRIELLKLIKEKGSINAASRELKMSYQQAWHFIKEMNELSPLPLVIRQRGGANGGGAELTKFGYKTIAEYENILVEFKRNCNKLSQELWLRFF